MVTVVNSKADVLKAAQALSVNLNAAKGLQEVMKSNLGPRGTLKMLVGGAGQIKITKDGSVLLSEMQIQHPTASMIARAASAQDEFTGDGTTSSVMFIGELMKLAEQSLAEGLHPRLIAEGFEIAREETVKFLDTFKIHIDDPLKEREKLVCVARTSLRTKIAPNLADPMAEVVVDAVRTIKKDDQPLDLNMVEILHMKNKLVTDSRLIKGLVLDHGARHPDMPKRLENCYILTANVSLEYEKSEVNAGFFYSSAEQREKLVDSERKFTDEKVKKIIELKKRVCTEENKKSFVLINQKGIDPPSLEMLAHEGIIALRRAKRRNMERLPLAVGGIAVNSVDDLDVDDLGHADLVYEQSLEDDKFTFIEGVKHPQSCTVLIQGSTDHSIAQMKDAIKDGLRAVQNCVEDEAIVPGAGAFEVAAHVHLEQFKRSVEGKPRLGVEIFGKALLVVPKTLLENSGMDVQEKLLRVLADRENKQKVVGVSISSGDPIDPAIEGIYDNFLVKKQMLGLVSELREMIASLAALDSRGADEPEEVELLVDLRTLREADKALESALPLSCKGFNLNPEFPDCGEASLGHLGLPSYTEKSQSLVTFEGRDQIMMTRLRRVIRDLNVQEASQVVEKLTKRPQPSLLVFSPADAAADAVEFEVERLSETLLGAAGLSGSGGGGRDLWNALVTGSRGALAEAVDESGATEGFTMPLDGLWLEALYNVAAIALDLRREEIQFYTDAWCTRTIEMDWHRQLDEIDETLGWVSQQVEHLKAKAQQVLVMRRLEGGASESLTVQQSFPPPSVLSLRWAMLKKPARDMVRELHRMRPRQKAKLALPADPVKPPPGLLSFQQWLQGPQGHAVVAKYRGVPG